MRVRVRMMSSGISMSIDGYIFLHHIFSNWFPLFFSLLYS